MSKSSMRIVLVDPLGEVLFSGESSIAPSAPPAERSKDECPETQRSATSDSGIYAIEERGPGITPLPSAEIRSSRTRAA